MSIKTKSKARNMSFGAVLLLILLLAAFKVGQSLLPDPVGPTPALAASKSDLNKDGVVDWTDLEIFSLRAFDKEWTEVDWCYWLEQEYSVKPTNREERTLKHARKHLGYDLRDFIIYEFGCGVIEPPEPNEPPVDPLAVTGSNDYPTRLALGPDYLYVTDSKAWSVFFYDPNDPNYPGDPVAELKNIVKPLGVAVDQLGRIYVGSDGSDSVEVYDASGMKIANIGKGLFKMPNDLAIDRDGKLYVADSKSDIVWVFDPNDGVSEIGKGNLNFPVALEIVYHTDTNSEEVGELFVVDQGNYNAKVFDLQGNYLRSFGRKVGFMGWRGGRFVKMQSLAVSPSGIMHVADCNLNFIQMFDPNTGSYIDYYGDGSDGAGVLNLPLDLVIDGFGRVIVANHGKNRVEIIKTVP